MSLVAILSRKYKADCTLGDLILPSGTILKTLERPWLNNKANISCIPDGVYFVKYMESSSSGKYKRAWHIQNVQGRSGILFHGGNLVRHTKGCVLVGLSHGSLGKEKAVLSSAIGLNKMRRELQGKDFILIVIGSNHGSR